MIGHRYALGAPFADAHRVVGRTKRLRTRNKAPRPELGSTVKRIGDRAKAVAHQDAAILLSKPGACTGAVFPLGEEKGVLGAFPSSERSWLVGPGEEVECRGETVKRPRSRPLSQSPSTLPLNDALRATVSVK